MSLSMKVFVALAGMAGGVYIFDPFIRSYVLTSSSISNVNLSNRYAGEVAKIESDRLEEERASLSEEELVRRERKLENLRNVSESESLWSHWREQFLRQHGK